MSQHFHPIPATLNSYHSNLRALKSKSKNKIKSFMAYSFKEHLKR